MRDQQNRTTVPVKLIDLIEHDCGILGIEIACRFVGQKDAGAIEQCAGHRDTLTLPDAQLRGVMVSSRMQTKLLHQLLRIGGCLGPTGLGRGHQDVFQHIQERE